MTEREFNTFCATLPHTHHVVQWGGAQVWKIAGKVFAIGGWNDESENLFVTFKCSPMSYELLKDQPGLRPAPYLASRGMKWIQRTGPETMDDVTLQDYLKASYKLVALGLPKKTQKELGLGLEG
jgi:predicted DNA-binding protein (MmcQ/YjbR family)